MILMVFVFNSWYSFGAISCSPLEVYRMFVWRALFAGFLVGECRMMCAFESAGSLCAAYVRLKQTDSSGGGGGLTKWVAQNSGFRSKARIPA